MTTRIAPVDPVTLKWSGMTHTGRFRKNNEDAFLALTADAREVFHLGKTGEMTLGEKDCIFAVSDGMGGANAGEFASRIAVDQITHLLPRAFRLDAMGMRQGAGDILTELFSRIHNEINRNAFGYSECKGMGATLSLCWFHPGWVHFCHVGDSRIYYLPADGGPIKQVSEDHSHVGWLLRTGQITEFQARTHPRRNLLSQVLGAGKEGLDPQYGVVGYEPGDRFVLCTDGISDGMSARTIQNTLNRPDHLQGARNPAESLIHEGNLASGRDNLTAVVIEILE